jgi:hypothetical protein
MAAKVLSDMLPVRRFRLYYGDGSTVTGTTEADWKAAPGTGVVICALLHTPPYTSLLQGRDWYAWHNGEWTVVDSVGPVDSGTHEPKPAGIPGKNIKRGDAVTDLVHVTTDQAAYDWSLTDHAAHD